MCLFEFRVTGGAPEWCFCNRPAIMMPKVHHVSHGTANHSIADFGKQFGFGAIDALTAVDHAVYGAAKKRFLADVRDMEARMGRQVLC